MRIKFDLTLVFGPMYHLKSAEEKLAALNEAKRVTKPQYDGVAADIADGRCGSG